MLMAFDIETSIKKRGNASPMEIFSDIGAHGHDDRATATKMIEQLVKDGHVEPRRLCVNGWEIPVFRWNYRRTV